MPEKFYDNKKGCWGFKDEQGAIVVPAVYDKVEDFENGFAVVQPDDREEWGLIDERGTIVIPCEYDFVIMFNDHWIHATKQEEEFLFNKKGELVLTIKDILYWHRPKEGVIQVKKNTGWGVIDMQGKTIIDFTYKSIGPCINGWLSYYEDGRWGWLKKEGGIAVPARFDEVGVLDGNQWWGKLGKVCYLYDYNKQEVGTESWEEIKKVMKHSF